MSWVSLLELVVKMPRNPLVLATLMFTCSMNRATWMFSAELETRNILFSVAEPVEPGAGAEIIF